MSVSIITDFTTANAKGAIIQGPLAEILSTPVQPGCRAYPSDVAGTYLEMGTDGKWDGASVGSFGSFVELYALPTTYLAFGARASVLGVQYTYGAGGWVKQVDGVECFETVDERNLAYPTAPKTGTEVGIRRLCGNGYFYQRYNGTRWESFGSIIADAGVGYNGYGLIATGTAYVKLVAYVIPADLFGNGEVWELMLVAQNGATSGNNTYVVKLGGKTISSQVITSNQYAVFCTRQSRRNATVDRTTTGVTYTGGSVQESINLSQAQTIEAGITPFAIGDISRILSWTYQRIA